MQSESGDGDLDGLDLQLIDHLQIDGRIPYVELARRLEVTEKTVRRRVSRLIDQGYVTIAAVTDPSLLGFGSMALALVTVDGSRSPVELADELAQLPETDYVTVTTGPFAVQVELICTDPRELHDVAFGKIRTTPGVAAVELLPYLRLHYQQARFSGVRGDRDGVRPRQLDETDRAIISRLAVDGRAAFRDFAAALGVSETTIRFRYTRLVESGAVRVMCIVNPLRLGYRWSSWVTIRVDGHGSARDVAEALTGLQPVSYVALTSGRWDVLAEVVTDSGEALLSVLDDDIRAIEGVAALESWSYIALHYKAVRPRRTDGLAGHDNDIQIV
ncbi:AsnC family transcriptional regulator [Mycolicibacterium litorale]|uniref:AsnC family transcriptional regulator n=1 Tax=Mycolicibacterium litorale TaxID=758802 RepID=A0A6S6P1Y5_9MYCO|nr:Lrp/AsnC family transcriptional regulator [Mycolicibacterium litorale]BCI51347.1 AsnC family transcriptional regulator [Mycolicibacterium litorale]